MRKTVWFGVIVILTAVFLTACGEAKDSSNAAKEESESEELKSLDVEFEVPEAADKGEEVELKALVTYGDEKVKDADEVQFEYWVKGNEDDSTKIDATNNEDGTYTANVTFDKNAVYEMFAHVTARDLHTMPKKSISVGDGKSDMDIGKGDSDGEHSHAEGFSMHFMEPDNVETDKPISLMVHVNQGEKPLEGVNVQYEILPSGNKDHTVWVDAVENKAGEYTAEHKFKESGTYKAVIHVEDGDDLHEHKEYEIEVK